MHSASRTVDRLWRLIVQKMFVKFQLFATKWDDRFGGAETASTGKCKYGKVKYKVAKCAYRAVSIRRGITGVYSIYANASCLTVNCRILYSPRDNEFFTIFTSMHYFSQMF